MIFFLSSLLNVKALVGRVGESKCKIYSKFIWRQILNNGL